MPETRIFDEPTPVKNRRGMKCEWCEARMTPGIRGYTQRDQLIFHQEAKHKAELTERGNRYHAEWLARARGY